MLSLPAVATKKEKGSRLSLTSFGRKILKQFAVLEQDGLYVETEDNFQLIPEGGNSHSVKFFGINMYVSSEYLRPLF
jgi:hypothetical protein